MTDQAQVLAALDAVRDPELDEPVTALGFVSSCTVSDSGDVQVRLRLPTYFCAPNFAFLMVADAYDAVSALKGVRRTEVVLDDHFASHAINRGIAARSGFADSFGDLAAGELDELRVGFIRKAVLAGTDRVCRPLLAAGRTMDELAEMSLGDVPPSPELQRLRERRTELALPADDASALLVDATSGEAVGAQALPLHLRKARLTRVNIEANGSMCRGMLASRYDTRGLGEMEEVR
ncbi:MAG: iron-sulfur cluster assembly protein [Nocardioidaceae bacterium]